jgi:hypothetical protein
VNSIFALSRAIDSAIADTSVPRVAVAANAFTSETGAPLTLITDERARERVRNHRTFARLLGAGMIQPSPRLPPPELVEAFKRHETAVYAALEAHIRGDPLPTYREPPLRDVVALTEWTPDRDA